MRLGCEAYALDLNPVAHIIELCTLVYPQKYGKPDANARGMTGPPGPDGKPTWGGLAEEVPAEKFLAEVEGIVQEFMLEGIFSVARSGVAAVDGPSRFYVLWRYTYKAAEMDAGEAIVFTYGQNVELDGQNGLSAGRRALVEKKKGKYRLYDFTERGDDERLGLRADDGTPAPLIDVLHRILWLIENEPRSLKRFLDEARPDRERLRRVAQALAETALGGRKDDGAEQLVATTASEQAAVKKLVANWRALIDQRLAMDEGTLFDMGRK